MAKREEYETKTEEFLKPLLAEKNFELVDVEYVKEAGTWYLRVFVDKEGGIGVDDCADVSRELGDWLDKKDFIEESYVLEVSSPGLGRPLKKDKDFLRETGKKVDIKLYKPIEKQKDFSGILKSYNKENIIIESEDGEDITFKRSDIALVRLAFDF